MKGKILKTAVVMAAAALCTGGAFGQGANLPATINIGEQWNNGKVT